MFHSFNFNSILKWILQNIGFHLRGEIFEVLNVCILENIVALLNKGQMTTIQACYF